MQRSSLYVLQATLFLVMMAAISEPSASSATTTVAVVIIAVINVRGVEGYMGAGRFRGGRGGCIRLRTHMCAAEGGVRGVQASQLWRRTSRARATTSPPAPSRSPICGACPLQVALVLCFLVAIGVEGHRFLVAVVDAEGKGRLTWGDVRRYLGEQCCCGGRRRHARPLAPARSGLKGSGDADVKAVPVAVGKAGGGSLKGRDADGAEDSLPQGDRDTGLRKPSVPADASFMVLH
jgi:hypothetical protein